MHIYINFLKILFISKFFFLNSQNILCPTAPPVVIRQLPSVPCTPEPLIVREGETFINFNNFNLF
jgi:hypothetical protein